MVPSWTETLLWAGAPVIGRTRFCIHPRDLVSRIQAIGGTKDLNLEALQSVISKFRSNPENGQKILVILDREENPKSFLEHFDSDDFQIHVTHVASNLDLEIELEKLAVYFPKLGELKVRLENQRAKTSDFKSIAPPSQLLQKAKGEWSGRGPLVYVIWKNPWMAVSPDTYIGSQIQSTFATELFTFSTHTKYPEFSLSQLPAGARVLLSTEPYPFAKSFEALADEIIQAGASYVGLIDGESMSWFGIRGLRALEDRNGNQDCDKN